MTIRLLQNVANELKGAVLQVSEDRAQRLIRTGYAERVEDPKKPSKRKDAWPPKA